MKTLLTLFVLLFSSSVLAESKLIHRDVISGFAIRTICIDGYKFVVVRDLQQSRDKRNEYNIEGTLTTSLSIVQFYENQNGKSVPASC
jgi:hypothetical protein